MSPKYLLSYLILRKIIVAYEIINFYTKPISELIKIIKNSHFVGKSLSKHGYFNI